MSNYDELLMVEMGRDGRPWMVLARQGQAQVGIDINWCERDQLLYYHESFHGPLEESVFLSRLANPDGPKALLWVKESLGLYTCTTDIHKEEVVERSELLAMGYELIAEMPAIDFAEMVEGDTSYCDVCDDRIPHDDECEHFCSQCGWHLTDDGIANVPPGKTLECETCSAAFVLLEVEGRKLVRRVERYCPACGEETDLPETLEPGDSFGCSACEKAVKVYAGYLALYWSLEVPQ